MATNETIWIAGVTYEVISITTAESAAAAGLVNLASVMREKRQRRQLGLRRPNGRGVVYHVVEFKHPRCGIYYGAITSLGRCS